MEVLLVQQLLNRAKRWAIIADDVHHLPENQKVVGRVLTNEQLQGLMQTAASNPDWERAYCAALLTVNTTCRGVELKGLKWSDVDIEGQTISIQRSKTEAGHRTIPLNDEAIVSIQMLRQLSEQLGGGEIEQFVFPACEGKIYNFTKNQMSWRTAWRSLTIKASLKRLRFHDLRHQAITEMAGAAYPNR